jgi:hypothetical protein
MFFHSFPRSSGNKPADGDKGLKILANVLKSGLLLAPEVMAFPSECRGEDNYRLVQSRFCLTQLDDLEALEGHAEHFGAFHLEFDDKAVYSLGAVPVMYLPKRGNRPDGGSGLLDDLGSFFIRRLLELQNFCTRAGKLKDILSANSFNETVTVVDEMAETYTVNVKQASTVLKMLCRDIESFDRVQGAIRGLASLFYPIDMERGGKYEQLHYFRQREWRVIRGIVPGEHAAGKASPIDEALSDEEKAVLKDIDPVFYEKPLEFIGGTKSRVSECSVIRKLDGQPVWEKMEYIIVPAGKLEAARELAKRYGIGSGKIVDMETRKGIKAKADAEKAAGRG